MGTKLGVLVLSSIAFVSALAIAGIGGCNVHEFGHLVVGKAMAIPIDSITWCAPASGRIAFSYQEPAVVGYAGGLLAASTLAGLWWFVIRTRLRSPIWWSVGVALLGTAIAQLIVGIWEGASPIGYDQAQGNDVGFFILFVVPLVVAATIQRTVGTPKPGNAPT